MSLFLHRILKAKAYDNQGVRFLHEKHDGHRVIFYRQDETYSQPIYARTRSENDLWEMLFNRAKKHGMWSWVEKMMRMPSRSSIDCELVLPGFGASAIKTAIAECDPNLTVKAFAVPWWNGEKHYDQPLQWAMDKCTALGIPFASFIDFQDYKRVDPDKYMEHCPAEVEGYVAKISNYTDWYKIKRVKTIDAFITNFKPGTGKYEGTLGALYCGVFDAKGNECEICCCSGMTDAQRDEIWAERERLLGRVIEIRYQQAASCGRLRHPVFVGWRDDKRQGECTVGQDVELLRYWSERHDVSAEKENE